MAKRRHRKLAALGTRGSPVSVSMLLAVGVGGFLVYRFIKALGGGEAEPIGPDQKNVEVVMSNDPKCQNLENQKATPSGCGTVKVLAYRADPANRTGNIREEVTISELPGFPGYYLQRSPVDAWSAFNRLVSAARAAKVDLQVNSAFRTMANQKSLYAKYQAGVGNLAALPGRSTHQYGVTVDIQVKGKPATLAWLRANAAQYGFFATVASEDWHWEYIAARDPALRVA